MAKAVIFDMDGVLIDSKQAWFIAFNRALGHFENKNIPIEEFDKYVWSKDFTKTSKSYFTVNEEKVVEFFNLHKEIFKSRIKAMDGALATLKSLRKKERIIGVATNTHHLLAIKMLKELGLSDSVDYLIGGDQVKDGKPEPDMLLKALQELRLRKSEAVFIGDTVWDEMAAKAAGIKFIGFQLESKIKINRLCELARIIR